MAEKISLIISGAINQQPAKARKPQERTGQDGVENPSGRTKSSLQRTANRA
jgi:hypothetical protein